MTAVEANRRTKRSVAADGRKQAILDAALLEFSERGFAGARLDDVARRAGVAKGTIYLLAKDKQDLLQQVMLGTLAPLLNRLAAASRQGPASLEEFRTLITFFRDEVMATDRKLVAQIVLKEAGRFPEIAEFYHREVISKLLAYVAAAAGLAERDGLLRSPAYARFPQLVVAPMLLALIWDALFAKFAPLDLSGLLEAHFEALFQAPIERSSS